MSKTVIRIEPESLVPEKTAERKLKVAGYARVSTDSEDQLNSYEAQLDYYVRMIKNHDNWIFVNMYSDEGISGTSTLNRPGFLAMIDDALSGKIDLIITKSVSRFARNTVDSLTAIRKLKQHNVEVFFEKENIWTFDSKGELLITIMSSIAQEESRSISENIRWGIRKSFSDGKVEFSQYKPYGYLTEDGKVTIREKEADVVRFIFHSSFEGWSFRSIVRFLNEEDIPSPMEMAWSISGVRTILNNEKYTGDAILQKTYTMDFLDKKRKPNTGVLPMWLVKNNHPAIISRLAFDTVARLNKDYCDSRAFRYKVLLSGRIFCKVCGNRVNQKIVHNSSPYRKRVWFCHDASHEHLFFRDRILTRLLLQRLNVELYKILKRKNTVVNAGEYAPSSELGTMVLLRFECLEDILPLSELPESLITVLFSKIIVARE